MSSGALWDVSVSDIQSDVTVADGAITGTLKYLPTGNAITNVWGAGNFMALQFDDIPEGVTSVKVGMNPSQGSGLVELINDPDKNGVFKVTDKDAQEFVVVMSGAKGQTVQRFSLKGLTCETE